MPTLKNIIKRPFPRVTSPAATANPWVKYVGSSTVEAPAGGTFGAYNVIGLALACGTDTGGRDRGVVASISGRVSGSALITVYVDIEVVGVPQTLKVATVSTVATSSPLGANTATIGTNIPVGRSQHKITVDPGTYNWLRFWSVGTLATGNGIDLLGVRATQQAGELDDLGIWDGETPDTGTNVYSWDALPQESFSTLVIAEAAPQAEPVTRSGPTVVVGQPLDLHADTVATELGYPTGTPYLFDPARSTVPEGVVLESNRAHGTPTAVGDFSLFLYYPETSDSVLYYRQPTIYTYSVEAAPVVVVPDEPVEVPDVGAPQEVVDAMAQRVVDFLGQGGDGSVETLALAKAHLPVILGFAEAYTRGRGFTLGVPDRKISGVVIAATCRLVANPGQIKYRAGEVSVDGGFSGWTLGETFVMNAYRRRQG